MFYVNLCSFIIHHFVNIKLTSSKENSLHFGKNIKKTETVKSPPKNGGDFSGKKGEKRVGKTIEKFRRKCVENPPEKVKNQA